MAAYAALAPLRWSLKRLLKSSLAPLHPASQEIIQSACKQMKSLLRVIQTFEASERSSTCYERAKALDRQIREAVYRVEDVIEPHSSSQYLSQNGKRLARDPNCPLEFTIDLEEVKQEINSFVATVQKIKEEYVGNMKLDESNMPFGRDKEEIELEELSRDHLDIARSRLHTSYYDEETVEDDEEAQYSEEELISTSNYQMVGLVDQSLELKSRLLRSSPSRLNISIVGMPGIGKTALAKQLYDDPLISNHFECRAFVPVGQKYQLKQVMIDILSQVVNDLDITKMQNKSVFVLAKYLRTNLVCKRYLLVLDDVWSSKLYDGLYTSICGGDKCRILVTTRIESAMQSFNVFGHVFRMRFLNKEESWSLLCEKVFGKGSWCPFELVEIGQKIAENCEGLSLEIIAIAELLAKGDMTLNTWKKISEDPNPLSIGTNNQHPMLDVLSSSYNPLPQLLKTCFLYMGVFPRKHEIVASNLVRLWMAEGFVKPRYRHGRLEDIGKALLHELSSQSVVVVIEPSSSDGVEKCKLHSVFWHMCVSEAKKENLFEVASKYSDIYFTKVMKDHRRLAIQNNTLFGLKDTYNSMSSLSNARSLLCTGQRHNYPIPMCLGMRLLRVLDALTIRFYEFPEEVAKLVQLRYLAFTYDGMVHASISELWNLQSLIVQRHRHIISREAPMYLPMEIWNMKELEHLQVTGALLPQPCDGAILPKLSTILDINAQSLTEAVVGSIPNLRKLGIQIDSSTQDSYYFFNHLRGLHKLQSLKCVVVNPKPTSQAVAPPTPSKILFP